ncbi:MAG: hypothetical protein Q7R69_02785 [bacterium]|nr:hypothetical protein [bacterium]
MTERFSPHFHPCGGHHVHLVTGPGFGASAPFASIPAGECVIEGATDRNDPQDVEDAARLKKELGGLKLRAERGRARGLYSHAKWPDQLVPYWTDFINNKLAPRESAVFGTFACDFVGRCVRETDGGDPQGVLRVKKVSEVLRPKVSV